MQIFTKPEINAKDAMKTPLSPERHTPPMTGSLTPLAGYAILDTLPEPEFDDLVQIAAQLCDAPIALLSLRDGDRQWFKAKQGLTLSEIPHSQSFCRYIGEERRFLLVRDTYLDERFSGSPYVCGEPCVRFYAGAPILNSAGVLLGTLSVMGQTPRDLPPGQEDSLMALSRQAAALLEMRKQALEMHQAREMTQTILQSSLDGFLLVGEDGSIRDVNDAYCRMMGYERTEVLQMSIFEQDADHSHEEITAHMRWLRGNRSEAKEVHHRAKNGRRLTLELSASYLEDIGGGQSGFCAFYRDITERQREQEARRESEARLQAVMEHLPFDFWVLDSAGCYVMQNPQSMANWGNQIGKSPEDLGLPAPILAAWRDKNHRALASEVIHTETTYQRHGTKRYFDTLLVPIHRDGVVHNVLGINIDITERKLLEAEQGRRLGHTETLLAEAVDQADRDPLTGLFNHRSFQKRLKEEAGRAEREGTSLAIAMLDLNNFKFFNDSYGHLAGDDVLRQVADGLRKHCRSSDIVARFGGDEFAVLMPAAAASEIDAMTTRLASCLDGLDFRPPDHDVSIPLGLSIGVAVFPEEAGSRLEAVDLADARLRLAKSGAGDTALAAARLRERLTGQVAGFSMLDALVTAVDNKDRYTRRHSEDVLTHSVQIAQQLGLDEQTQQIVEVAALLHDVGKIAVPDAILRKPGKLTEDEFAAVQQHPMMGAIIVGAIPGFEQTLDAVRHHHERWDGGGYPFGLFGEETPLIARLLAVADAFSAMTTDRPYRKGMPSEKAQAILQDGAGSQWDPACVAAFLSAREQSA
jgi:diguanylate cyclase (GGDEF)-like protein/PAS domain S-box-containing protein